MSAYSQKRTLGLRYLSFDRFRAVLDGTNRARYRADTVISCAMSLPKVQVL